MKVDFIPFMQIRGGSSKGIYFKKDDLPNDEDLRNEVILGIVGRDSRQIDGLGGANPLTSKVAIVSKSTSKDFDIDFLFAQVVVGENRVDTSPNCGNILAGVGIFAIESELVIPKKDITTVRVNMLNSGDICELVLNTPNKKLQIDGDLKIDGVSGTSAPIICNYVDVAGSVCGSLFPTGNKRDNFCGVNVTCIDNGMPVLLIPAEELQLSGYESCVELSENRSLREKLEAIRLEAGPKMNLGDVSNKVVPKISIISKPTNGGNINTRTFIPHNCHAAIGVLGAASVASACLFDECVTSGICELPNGLNKTISVEHPSGEFTVELTCEENKNDIEIKKVGLLRTARLLSKGIAYPKLTNYGE